MFACEKGKPPALIAEWCENLAKDGDFIFFWTGAVKWLGHHIGWGCLGDHFSKGDGLGAHLSSVSPERIERLATPFANAGRMRVMQAIANGPLSATELSKASGFSGGSLYHHLRELERADLVIQENKRYRLTKLGCQLLIAFSCMAGDIIEDQGEKGLDIGGKWHDGGGKRG